jgi:hypothetical protein
MAKTIGTTIYGGLIALERRVNRRIFKKDYGIYAKKRLLWRRGERAALPDMSYFYDASAAWNLLSDEVKGDWETAAIECAMSGYNLFLQDKIYRLKNEIAGNATPSVYHQYKVGQITISPSAGHFLFRQVGSDIFSSAPSVVFNYKADLTSENGGGEYIKVRLSYRYLDGEEMKVETAEKSLNLSQAWVDDTFSLDYYDNQTGYFELEIEGDLVNGTFLIDNIRITTDEGIPSRDPNCNRFERFYHALICPVGVVGESAYPAD